MKQVKKELAQELEKHLDTEINPQDIETPQHEHGDYAYPCMKAAAKQNKNPRELAKKLQNNIKHELIEKTEIAGPGYLNFYLNRKEYTQKVVQTLEKENMGVKQKNGEVLVEFSSPNIAKPMHIGHVRNNCLGDSLQRILRFNGYKVTSENYLGDWGAQFGKSIFAFKKYGSEKKLDEKPMEHIYNLYVKFHEEAENDPEINEKAAEWTKKIEEGDEEAERLWSKLREITIEYNNKDYQRMNINFDRITGESKVVDQSKKVLEEGLEKNIFKRDEDRSIYVDFKEDNLPNTVVQKADGTTLYITRDIANIKKRQNEGFDENIYVVASEQDLHFQQLFKIAERFNYSSGMSNEHVSYGMLQLQEGSMSSREGNIITLSDMLDKAENKAEEKIKDREIDNAEKIALGAVKYANLSVSRNKDIKFDWESVLDFEGDSGPYLQYSNTRAQSILNQANQNPKLKGKITESEYKLTKKLAEFPEKIEDASKGREPAKIANYLSKLCEEFNRFYHESQVINENKEKTTQRRLKLVETFEKTTREGLNLLGIETVKEM